MTDTTEPYKLVLCILDRVQVLSFRTESAADFAEEHFKLLGFHTIVVKDDPADEVVEEAPADE